MATSWISGADVGQQVGMNEMLAPGSDKSVQMRERRNGQRRLIYCRETWE
jgi:hypothetical protein